MTNFFAGALSLSRLRVTLQSEALSWSTFPLTQQFSGEANRTFSNDQVSPTCFETSTEVGMSTFRTPHMRKPRPGAQPPGSRPKHRARHLPAACRPLLVLFCLFCLVASGCDRSRIVAPPPPVVAISVANPAISQVVDEDLACLEVPVTIRSLRSDRSGRLEAIEVSILVRGTDVVLARNRRPNESFTYAETSLPGGGTLEAAGGVCYARSDDELEADFRAEVEIFPPGEEPTLVVAEFTSNVVESR